MAKPLNSCPECGGVAAEDRDCAGFYNYRCTKCPFGLYGDFEHHMTGRAAWNRQAKTPALEGETMRDQSKGGGDAAD